MSTVRYPHIAFIGKAGAGKSTAAKLLIEEFGLGYERLSFAAPLKVGCGTTTDRELLQRVGQGVRDLYPDFWVNLLLHGLYNDPGHPINGDVIHDARFVVDDCRYPNEVAALKLEGFVIVRVAAPRNVRVVRLRANGKLTDESQLEHESETALDDYVADYRVLNNGYHNHLRDALTDVLNQEAK